MNLPVTGGRVYAPTHSQPEAKKRTTRAERDDAAASRYAKTPVDELRGMARELGTRTAIFLAVRAAQGDADGICLWSLERVAAAVGASVPTVRLAVRRMHADGLLEVVEGEDEKRGVRAVIRPEDVTEDFRRVRRLPRTHSLCEVMERSGTDSQDSAQIVRAAAQNDSVAAQTDTVPAQIVTEIFRSVPEHAFDNAVSPHHHAELDDGASVHERRAERRAERLLDAREERRADSPETGADAPERPDMPITDQWRDLQAEAEDLWSTTDERPTDAPKADATSPSAEKPDVADATTPSSGGGSHAGEPQQTPATPPPHCAPPPAAQQEPRQGSQAAHGATAHASVADALHAPAGFVLEPPAPAGQKRGKAQCPPATLAHLRAAWCKHVGGRASMVPAGFAEACAELVHVCRGDLDLVERAFRGFALSDWHMGRDEKSGGKKWCHPKYVVRALDEFLSLADEADAPKGRRAEAHLAALQDIAEMRAEHVPTIEQEILRIPRSDAADVVRHGLDHAGTVRGVRVAYRAERAEDDARGTRQFAAFTLRYATNQVLCGMTAERWGADSPQARAQRTITQSFRLALHEVATWHARHNAEVDAVLDAAVVPPDGFDPAAAISACASDGERAQEAPPASAPQEVIHA